MIQRIDVTHTRLSVNDLLERTFLPKFQRLDDKEHTERIAQGLYDYYTLHGEVVLVGSISLADMNKDKHVLLDGQHRIRALEILCQRIPDLRWNCVRVDIYRVESEDEARGIYHIINSSKKVDLYTGDVTPFVIPQVQRYFRDRYPDHCKTSNKPLGLNINLEHLARHLIGRKVIDRLQLTIDGADLLVEKIKQLNQFYSDQPPARFIEWGVKDYDKRYKELVESKNPFFLGLYRNYEWIDRLTDPKPFEEQEHHAYVVKRQSIPKKTRQEVWRRAFGTQIEGQCYCCGGVIRNDDFHACHKQSVYHGGSNDASNLEPGCSSCNLSMGTMHIDDYKKIFHS